MKDINFVKDNGKKTDEYLDAEIIVDNEDPNDAARIAHEIYEIVDGGYEDNGDVMDNGFWKQIQAQVQADVRDPDVANEVLKIIQNEYL